MATPVVRLRLVAGLPPGVAGEEVIFNVASQHNETSGIPAWLAPGRRLPTLGSGERRETGTGAATGYPYFWGGGILTGMTATSSPEFRCKVITKKGSICNKWTLLETRSGPGEPRCLQHLHTKQPVPLLPPAHDFTPDEFSPYDADGQPKADWEPPPEEFRDSRTEIRASILRETAAQHGPKHAQVLLSSVPLEWRSMILESAFHIDEHSHLDDHDNAAECRKDARFLVSDHNISQRSALDYYNDRTSGNPWAEVHRQELLRHFLVDDPDTPSSAGWREWVTEIRDPRSGAYVRFDPGDDRHKWRAPSEAAAMSLIVGCLPEDIQAADGGTDITYNASEDWSVQAFRDVVGALVVTDHYRDADGNLTIDEYRVSLLQLLA